MTAWHQRDNILQRTVPHSSSPTNTYMIYQSQSRLASYLLFYFGFRSHESDFAKTLSPQSKQVQWSIAPDQGYCTSLLPLHHCNQATPAAQHTLEMFLWISLLFIWIDLTMTVNENGPWINSDRLDRLGPWELWKLWKKKLTVVVVFIYMELFILRLLFTDASLDTSQLRGFASAALGSNAQLTMKGILRMDGRLLIKGFYVT